MTPHFHILGLGSWDHGDDAAGLLTALRIAERGLPSISVSLDTARGARLLDLVHSHVPTMIMHAAISEPERVGTVHKVRYPDDVAEMAEPSPQEQRETYLVIREQRTLEIITIIETLSPANKRASIDGREQYLENREEILRSRTNLVELDLLRGGKRLPVIAPPAGDYFAIIRRGHHRSRRADVFHWNLRQPLPEIKIPLKEGEPEVPLNLHQVFTTVYDRARYQLSLDYTAQLKLPLADQDLAWVAEVTRQKA